MKRFVTVDEKATGRNAVLWEETEGKLAPLGVYASADAVPGAGEIEVWTFDVPTTLQVGNPAINEASYPMVDRDGAPLWEGARIAFTLSLHRHVHCTDGGTFGRANRYGGHSLVSDRAHPVYDAQGFSRESRREMTNAGGDYRRSGDLKGFDVLARKVGDPYEHGTTDTYVRLDSDPRDVCTLAFDPAPSPGR
jgi:hypothetical protein